MSGIFFLRVYSPSWEGSSSTVATWPLFFVLRRRGWLQALSHFTIFLPVLLDILFGQPQQAFSPLLVALHKHAVARLVIDILLEGDRRLFGVDDQRVLALKTSFRVVAIQRPVPRLHR